MRDYFIRRFLLIPPTLLGVTIIVFAITRLVPGGPLERAIMESQQFSNSGAVSQMAGADMALSEAQLKKLQEYYGFDKPVLESYLDWLGKVVQGDLGGSYRYNEPVWDVIRDRFPVSLYYGLVTLVITYIVMFSGIQQRFAYIQKTEQKLNFESISITFGYTYIHNTKL